MTHLHHYEPANDDWFVRATVELCQRCGKPRAKRRDVVLRQETDETGMVTYTLYHKRRWWRWPKHP